MSYPEPKAKYAGQDRAAKLCRADGGAVTGPSYSEMRQAFKTDQDAKKAGIPTMQQMGMQDSQGISDAVPRRKE